MSGTRRALVTGAGGFVGTHLCKALHADGWQVCALGRRLAANLAGVTESRGVDIRDREALNAAIGDLHPNAVVHLAASRTRANDLEAYRAAFDTNVMGTLNVIEACDRLHDEVTLVVLGSAEEYGTQTAPFAEDRREHPVTAYGAAKLSATHLVQSLVRGERLRAVVLRPSVVYGPGQHPDMFLPSLIRALTAGERFPMSAGEQTRDFLYITDLLSAIVRAMVVPAGLGHVINVSSGEPVKLRQVARLVAGLIGPDTERLLDIGARGYRDGEVMDYQVGNDVAKRLLAWRPSVPLQDGLRATVEHFRSAAVS